MSVSAQNSAWKVEHAKSNIKTAVSQIWVIFHVLPLVKVAEFASYPKDGTCDLTLMALYISNNEPYAYDVTEGRPRVLGVKRGTVTCAIAKHAASVPTPACYTAGPARARALTERLRAPTLFQHNTCAQRDKS